MNIKKHFARTITLFSLAAAVLVVALTSLVVIAAGDVETVIDYDPPVLPEGIALDKSGNIYVSMANQSEIRKITPDGTESVLATLPVCAQEESEDEKTVRMNRDSKWGFYIGPYGWLTGVAGTVVTDGDEV